MSLRDETFSAARGTPGSATRETPLVGGLREIREIAGPDARVALHLRHGDLLVTVATEPPILFGSEAGRASIDSGLAGRVSARREALYLADLTEIPGSVAPREPLGVGARSYLGLPLIHRDELLGVLHVDSPADDAFPPATRERIGEVAAAIGRSIGAEADAAREESPAPPENAATGVSPDVEEDEPAQGGDPAPPGRTDDDSLAIATVAHELRAPVAAIRGLADTLGSSIARYNRDLTRELARRISRATERLERTVNDLYDLARSGLAGMSVHPVPLDVAPLLERLAADQPEDSPLWLDLELDLPKARADPDRLQQALENLISNARRFAPPATEVRLAARLMDARIAVEVADRGPGIDPAIRDRIFDAFVRSEERGGLGLGLALVRRIADAMGAEIEVDSAPGVGSTFRLLLPSADEAVSDARRTPPGSP